MLNYLKNLSIKNLLKILIILLLFILPKHKSILIFFVDNEFGRFVYSVILLLSAYYNMSISVLLIILYIRMIKNK